jgi:thioredoxin 1
MRLIEVTADSFEHEVLGHELPVVVDFSAEWCVPCRSWVHVVEALADRMVGRARFLVVDVDASPDLAWRFGIRAIPTFIKFDAGSAARTVIGPRSRRALVRGLGLDRL